MAELGDNLKPVDGRYIYPDYPQRPITPSKPTVEELILKLKQLEEDTSITTILTPLQEQEGYYVSDLHPLVQNIISLAHDVLISEKGQVEWVNVRLLKQEGFPVGPGDSDSFSWLTGLIKTSKGDIMFG